MGRAINDDGKAMMKHGNNMAATWRHHGKKEAISWGPSMVDTVSRSHGNDMTKVLPQPGKNIANSWQEHGKNMADTWPQHGKSKARAWQ